MNDQRASKEDAINLFGDAASLLSGGIGFAGRVGLKRLGPILERTAFGKTLTTAVEVLGQAGKTAKGSDLTVSDWLTIGFPIGWNKKNPLFQETLNILKMRDLLNNQKLSKAKNKLHKAEEIRDAYLAIKQWQQMNAKATKIPERPTDDLLPRDGESYSENYRRRVIYRIKEEHHNEFLDRRKTGLDKYLKAIQTLKNAGFDTGLQDNAWGARQVVADDKEWGKMIVAGRNIPQREKFAARWKDKVAELENLDSGLKLMLHWLLN